MSWLTRKTGATHMLFRDFQEIIKLLQGCADTQSKCAGILYPSVFEEHNILISTLLKQVYTEHSVEYILNEWLCGNKNPIVFTSNRNVTREIPIATEHDLWKAMETYGRKIK